MTLNLMDRGSLIEIMWDLWLSMGQEEEVRPYSEPHYDNKDLWVTEEMVKLLFE